MIHFTSETWFLDLLKDSKNSVRAHGRSDFGNLKNFPAELFICDEKSEVLGHLTSLSACLKTGDIDHPQSIHCLIEDGHRCGYVHYLPKCASSEAFLAINVIIDTSAFQKLWSKIIKPCPIGIFSASTSLNSSYDTIASIEEAPIALGGPSLTLKY